MYGSTPPPRELLFATNFKTSRHILSLICRSRALILIPRKIGSRSQKLGIVKTCQTMFHDWLMSVARGKTNGRSKIWSILLKDSGAPAFTQGHTNLGLLPALQTQLWIYKLYYTTYMKKYPVLCVWARSLIQKYCRAFIHFASIVWTSFSEQVENMARLHARNVAESFKFPGAVILKIYRPTFEWTVCWM